MSDLSTKFAGLQDQLTTQQAAMVAYVDTVETKLQAIWDQLDLVLTNNSVNAQAIIAAIVQNSCPCVDGAPLVPLPGDDTPFPGDEIELCQRIQYFLDLFRLGFVSALANYFGDTGFLPNSVVQQALSNALADVDISTGQLAQGVPSSTASAIASAFGSGLAVTSAAGVEAAVLEVCLDGAVWEAVRQAMFVAPNAAEARTEALAVLSGIDAPEYVANIFTQAFYSAWANDIFSDTPVVDASGYSGEACGLLPCYTLESVPTSINGGANQPFIEWPSGFEPVNSVGSVTSNKFTWATIDMVGWTIVCDADVGIYHDEFSGPYFVNEGAVFTMPVPTTYVVITSSVPFTATVCQPDPS